MTAYLCPVFQEPQFTDNDEFLAGGLLWFYEAGTSTLATAYTTEDQSAAWPNPIVLNSRGESGGTIWLAQGQAYRIVLEGKPAYGQTHGAVITEHDDITGINDPSVGATDGNWILFAGEPTYISGTSFSVPGDFRDVFAERRRVYSINNSGVVYSSVSSASYAAGVTTVNVVNDSGTLDVGLSAVYYSFSLPIALPTDIYSLGTTFNNPGYIWNSDGTTIQWGVTSTNTGGVTVTLPLENTSTFVVMASPAESHFSGQYTNTLSGSSFKIYANVSAPTTVLINWVAIGKKNV